jgi:hypothetical protein
MAQYLPASLRKREQEEATHPVEPPILGHLERTRLQNENDCRESSCPDNKEMALKAKEVNKRKDSPKYYWLREGRSQDLGLQDKGRRYLEYGIRDEGRE